MYFFYIFSTGIPLELYKYAAILTQPFHIQERRASPEVRQWDLLKQKTEPRQNVSWTVS